MGFDFQIYHKKLYFLYHYSTSDIEQFKSIPKDDYHYDESRNLWEINMKNISQFHQISPIPSEILSQFFQFKIVIGSCFSKIIPITKKQYDLGFIDHICSFEIKGAKYTYAYKSGDWDGFYHLYNKNRKSFPTGLLETVKDGLESELYDYYYEWDYTEPSLHDYDFSLYHIQFRDYQEQAILQGITKKRGILQLATGAGKSSIAVGIIAHFGVKTLFLVHTKDLLYQAYKTFSYLLQQPIGLIGDGQCQIETITIATIQSLVAKIDNTEELIGDWNYDIEQEYDDEEIELIKSEKPTNITKQLIGDLFAQSKLIILDECLTGDTVISMEDGNYKYIKNIENGDHVIGGIVSNKFEREVNKIIKITTSFGNLETTINHPNFCILHRTFNDKLNQYIDSNKNNIQIIESKDLQIGNLLLIPYNLPLNTISSDNLYEQSLFYFIGMIMCDGHLDLEHSNRIKIELHKEWKIKKALEIFQIIGNHFQIKYNQSIIHRNGIPYATLISFNSKELKEYIINQFGIPRGKKSNIIDINPYIYNNQLDCIKSFIQACFDCEGCVYIKHKWINFSSTSIRFVKKLQLLLLKFGIKANIIIRNRKEKNRHICYCLDITGQNINIFAQQIGFTINYHIEKLNQILTDIKKRSMSKSVVYQNKQYHLEQIKNIEIINQPTKVYDFTTESHSFIANGFLTHNCQHLPANSFYKIIMKCNTPYKIGLSATPKREDGFDLKLEAGIGNIIYRLSASELIKRGYLVQPHIKFIHLPTQNFPRKTQYQTVYKQYIVDNVIRNTVIQSIAIKESKNHHQILILVKEIRHLNILHDLIPESVIIHGSLKSDERNRILMEFRQRHFSILIATSLADEGLDIANLNVLILAGSGKSSTKTIQRIGRVIRLGDICPNCQSTDVNILDRIHPCECKNCGHSWIYNGKTSAIVYDFIDNAKWVYDHYLKRKDLYESEIEFKLSRHKIKFT